MESPEIVGKGGEAAPEVAEKMRSKMIEEGGEEKSSFKVEEPATMGSRQVEDDEGPPPGWHTIARSPPPTERMGSKELEGEEKVEITGDQEGIDSKYVKGEEDNPTHSEIMKNNQIKLEKGGGGEVHLVHAELMEVKEEVEDDDNDDDGPPPGWYPIVPLVSKLSPSLSPTGTTEGKEIEKDVNADISIEHARTRTIVIKEEETVPAHTVGVQNEEIKEGEDVDDDGPPPGWQHIVHSSPEPSPPILPIEMAQMVCGSCRQLLSYPRGVRHVKCSCCQTVNLVLEEHQVGQVKCGSCYILLMYPYGAPSVRCSCCRFVTQIGDHNKRTPWSSQQGRPIPTPHLVQ